MIRINIGKKVLTIVAVFCIILNSNSQKIIQTTKNTTNKTAIPTNVKALISKTLEQPFENLNTDWFGTIQAEAILRWADKGYPEGIQYVENWLNYHIDHDNKLTDEENIKTY